MQKLTTLILAGVSAYLLAGCSASGVNPVSPSRVCSLSSNVLQLNVGTANLFGTATGTNVAVTFRQSAAANCYAGDSGALVSTPTLTLPTALAGPAGTADLFGATILTGPAAGEIGTTSMTGIGQTPADTSNTSATATFGDDGGAFGLGIEPFNEAAHLGLSGDTGVPPASFHIRFPFTIRSLRAAARTTTSSFRAAVRRHSVRPASLTATPPVRMLVSAAYRKGSTSSKSLRWPGRIRYRSACRPTPVR